MQNTIQKAQQGFTLIELMIVVAIMGILASVAIPSYQNYTKKAKFTEVIMATSAVKIAVELCVQSGNALNACDSGAFGIPTIVTVAEAVTGANPIPAVVGVSVTDGIITATGTNAVDSKLYTLTPNVTATAWTKGGNCVDAGYC